RSRSRWCQASSKVKYRAAPQPCRRKRGGSSPQAACRSCGTSEISGDHGRIFPHLARPALGNTRAEVENHEVVHQSHNKAHVMLHEQDAHAVCPQFSKKRRKLLLFAMAQPRRWFVQQQNGRVERKSARDFENAHLPESEVACGAVLELRQPHALQLAHCFAEKGGFLRTLQAKNAF